eukprot:352186-Chlamydomonas_euryale.AAC.8
MCASAHHQHHQNDQFFISGAMGAGTAVVSVSSLALMQMSSTMLVLHRWHQDSCHAVQHRNLKTGRGQGSWHGIQNCHPSLVFDQGNWYVAG